MATNAQNKMVEGFICPECHDVFTTPEQLQDHYLNFHENTPETPPELEFVVCENDEITDVDLNYNPLDGMEHEIFDNERGHTIESASLNRLGKCDVCENIVFSICYVCLLCKRVCHPKCLLNLPPCEGHAFATKDGEPHLKEDIDFVLRKKEKVGISGIIRRVFSKKTDRYTEEGFDLDLTYITDKIIAMSFPGTGVETVYRNGLKDVAKLLKSKHGDYYLVFNLSERRYDISKLNNQVLDFGWPDHLAPSLDRLCSICKSIASWLDSDSRHVAVVHCVGGKGRTGVVIAAYLQYSSICSTPESALDKFAMHRFFDEKNGVNQPSQRRYVYYFADLLAGQIVAHNYPVLLMGMTLHGVPNLDGKGGGKFEVNIYQDLHLVYTTQIFEVGAGQSILDIPLEPGLILKGDILIRCFHKTAVPGKRIVAFRVQFPSFVIETEQFIFKKEDLDDTWKDKKFPDDGFLEIRFLPKFDEHSRMSMINPITHLLSVDDAAKRNTFANFLPNYSPIQPTDTDKLITHQEIQDSTYTKVDLSAKTSLPPQLQIEDFRTRIASDCMTPPPVVPYLGGRTPGFDTIGPEDIVSERGSKIYNLPLPPIPVNRKPAHVRDENRMSKRNSKASPDQNFALIEKTVSDYKSKVKHNQKYNQYRVSKNTIERADTSLERKIGFDDIIICHLPDTDKNATLANTILPGIDLESLQKHLSIDSSDWSKLNYYKNENEILELIKKEETRQLTDSIEHWYKPSLSRDEATAILQTKSVGHFIIRDSSTVNGGYALSLRVPDDFLQLHQNLADSKSLPIHDIVRHFLIAPHMKGVRLQGWEEPPFENLTTFVHRHTNEAMSLPCKLKGPVGVTNQVSRVPVPSQKPQSLQNIEIAGKAVYLGGLSIVGKGTKFQIEEVAKKLSEAKKSLSILVEIRVSTQNGISVIDVNKRAFDKRQFNRKQINFTAQCPTVKWEGRIEEINTGKCEDVKNAVCFGIVVDILSQAGSTCLIFADPSPSNISHTLISFINSNLLQNQ